MRLLKLCMALCLPLRAMAAGESTPLGGLPLLRGEDAISFPWGNVTFALVVAAIVAVIWARRYRSGYAPVAWWPLVKTEAHRASDLQVISSARLDKSCVLHDVRWQGRRLLVASSDSGVATVAESLEKTPGASEVQT
ncbi:MAG: hypothetical protein QM639_02140 [Rhodocyclaceae bacterium]